MMTSLPAPVPATMVDGQTIFASIDNVQAAAINALIAYLAANPLIGGVANGVTADLLIDPDNLATAILAKHVSGGSWGVPGTTYGADQFIELLSDSNRVASYIGGNAGGVITAVSNTTPIEVTVAAGHSYLPGDTASVRATGVAAIDGKWFKVTVISGTVVSLDGTVASGAATLTANSVLWGDPNPVMFRVDAGGSIGVRAIHVAPDLRGFAGESMIPIGGGGGAAIWLQPHDDIPGVMAWNADNVSNKQTLVSQFFLAVDVHSAVARTVWAIEADGVETRRRQSGKADTAVVSHLRNDADNADVFYLRADGGVYGGGVSSFGNTTPVAGVTMLLQSVATGNTTLFAVPLAGQTADIFLVNDATFAVTLFRINKNGYPIIKKNAAPADAELSANEIAIWYDSTNGAGKFMCKAKQADGTVKTGSFAVNT